MKTPQERLNEILAEVEKTIDYPFVTAQFGDNWREHAIEHYSIEDIANTAWRQGRKAILLERYIEEMFVRMYQMIERSGEAKLN